MALILGLDPSLAKAGYVILDTDEPNSSVVEKGLLKTSTADGLLLIRLLKQQDAIRALIDKYSIKFVGMEAPFFGSWNTERLFALNQFIHKVFYDTDQYVVAFPPQMLKKLTFQDRKVGDIGKPEMIDKAKTELGLQGKRLAEDVADAYWAGTFGKKFYLRYIEEKIKDEDLTKYELDTFAGKHTYTRGMKKGITDYTGVIYRENELFFNFKEIKRRMLNGSSKDNKKSK